MALLITNPRHIRRNGVLNRLIAKHLAETRRGADADMGRRSVEHREDVREFKRDAKRLEAFKREHAAEIEAARKEKAERRAAAREDKSKHFLVAKAGYSVDASGKFVRPGAEKPASKKQDDADAQLSFFAGSESGAIPARTNKRKTMKKIRRKMKRRFNPVALRMNGVALRMNRKARRAHAKKARRHHRRNPIALRMNSIAIRTNGKKRHAKRHHAKRHHARRHHAKRHNPAFIVPNGKKRKHSRKHHRKHGMFAKMRRNFGMALTMAPLASARRFLKAELALPVIGAGVAVGAAHYFAAPQVAKGIEWVGSQAAKVPVVGEYAQKGLDMLAEHAAYTTTGLVAGAALAVVGAYAKRPQLGMALGAAAVTSGLAMDALGFLSKRETQGAAASQMGALYESFPPRTYGAVGAEAVDYGAVAERLYGDAQMADAAVCGKDFSPEEGQALVEGPAAVMAVAGTPSVAQGVRRTDVSMSRFAGLRMHRWGWLIKAVGFDRARKIALLAPSERLKVIDQLRKQAMASADASLSASANALPDYGAVAESFSGHGAMGASAAGAYGAELVIGGGY